MQLSGISEPLDQTAGAAAAAAAAGGDGIGASQLPAIREAGELRSATPSGTITSAGSRGLPGSAAAAAGAAGAAAAAAGAAGIAAAAALGGLPAPPPPIRVSASGNPDDGEQRLPGVAAAAAAAAGNSGTIHAFVRDASAADTHDKVQHWLKHGPDSSELSPAVQQRLLEQRQQQQQQLAAQASAPHTDAGRQQQQQQQQGQDAAAAAARAAAMQARQQSDVVAAEDSPFFALLPSCGSTGSVELGPFKRMSPAATNQSAVVQGGQAPRAFGSLMPAFMDPK